MATGTKRVMGPPHAVERYDEERKAVDACVTALEHKWGIDRLETLCRDPELRRKFQRQRKIWNDVFWVDPINVQTVQREAIRTMRAYEALEAHAEKVGIEPLAAGRVIEVRADNGDVWVIVPSVEMYVKEPDDERDRSIIGADTLINLFLANVKDSPLPEVMRLFPGTKVSQVRVGTELNDELPF